MLKIETKKLFVLSFFVLAATLVFASVSLAIDFTSSNFAVKDPVIDQGSQSSASLNFGLGQSFGQVAIGRSTSGSYELWSGFQYFFKVNANVLTAAPGAANGEVDLSWTVPATFLGMSVDDYEVGTGTVSGSYTFQNVGNVTNFTKSGLTPGTLYYFIVKTLGPGGVFLVYSNEASATATGVAPPPPPPPPSGGGGGSQYNAAISVTGMAYPTATVTLLRDGYIISTVTADGSGAFTFNVTNLNAGTYNFSVYATDAFNDNSPSTTFIRTLQSSTTASVNDVVVGPTLRTSHTSVKQGESFSLSGYSAPNTEVTINFTGTENKIYKTTAGTTGQYSLNLNASLLKKGDYEAKAFYKLNGVDSPFSFAVIFSVGDQTVPTPDECKRSDLNCDGRVNLVDFSILLYFWDSTEFSRNPRADIDKSGQVGLRDLSIMMYDWTG
jgi:hypothetical protein